MTRYEKKEEKRKSNEKKKKKKRTQNYADGRNFKKEQTLKH